MNDPTIKVPLVTTLRSLAPLNAALASLADAAWPATAAAHAHPASHMRTATWAGYAIAAPSPLRSVSGQCAAPRPTCQTPFASFSAFRVGLGGFTEALRALEQIGTGTERVSLHIQDLTAGTHYDKTTPLTNSDTSSAEWIAEAPSECPTAGQRRPLPLADCGTVRFTHARAGAGSGESGTITDPAFETSELTLAAGTRPLGLGLVRIIGDAGQAKLSPTSHNGGAFTVDFAQTTQPQPPLPPAAQDRLSHSPSQTSRAGSRATVGDMS